MILGDKELLEVVLGLVDPWYIDNIVLIEQGDTKGLHVYIDHKKDAHFNYNEKMYPVRSHQNSTWRHLPFYGQRCFLHAKVPRIQIDEEKIRLVDVMWGQHDSPFTCLFEKDALELMKGGMNENGVSRQLGIEEKLVSEIVARNAR